MAKHLVILSAEIAGADIQEQFGKLPSAMIPLEQRPALDYIYHENVNHYDKISIVVYKEAHFIREFLFNTQYKIELIELPKAGDLCYSLEYALENINLETELTVLFGDTYVPNMNQLISGKDIVLYSLSDDSQRWTVVHKNDDGSAAFIDKEVIDSPQPYPIVIGAFNFTKPALLLEQVRSNSTHYSNRFYSALKSYLDLCDFDLIHSSEWVDYGHIDKYFEQKKRVAPRAFNQLVINTQEGTIEKRSQHSDKFNNEIRWFLEIPEDLKKYTPTVFDYSLEEGQAFIKLQFYNFVTLHEIFVHGNHDLNFWEEAFHALKNVISDFESFKVSLKQEDICGRLAKMYISKTQKRLATFENSGVINSEKPIVINGEQYFSLKEYIQLIEPIVKENGLLEARDFQIIHGDLFFANVLFDNANKTLKIVDPRGSFGKPSIYGDVLYEWAKVAHSIDGLYDLIVEDKFNVVNIDNNINYKIQTYSRHTEIKNLFYSKITPEGMNKKIILVQSLLFFAMLPLHKENLNRQLLMLSRAIELFHPFVKKLK